jgi:transposase
MDVRASTRSFNCAAKNSLLILSLDVCSSFEADGPPPLKATVYEMERLRCNACGEVFTAPEPDNASPDKYDERAVAMIALLKYGSGIPFYRLGKLENNLGMPLPAATQWEEVEAAAEILKPAFEELIRQAAQGDVLHNDDTGMRVLRLAREPADKRTGVFTSGIVATQDGRAIPSSRDGSMQVKIWETC